MTGLSGLKKRKQEEKLSNATIQLQKLMMSTESFGPKVSQFAKTQKCIPASGQLASLELESLVKKFSTLSQFLMRS